MASHDRKVAVEQYVFKGLDEPATTLWLSGQVIDELASLADKDATTYLRLMKRLERYCRNGFDNYTGAKKPIRSEWDEVFRIGHKNSLFRISGFFAGENTGEFIAIDAYSKRGQKLSAAERNRIDGCAEVKRKKLWEKRAP